MSVYAGGDRNNSLTQGFVGPATLAIGVVASVMQGHPHRGPRAWSLHPRRPYLGLSYRCPPDMHMVLIVSLCCSRLSCFCPEFKNLCRGDSSRDSMVPVTRRQPVVALPTEVVGAGGAPQGADGIEMADASPRLGNSIGSL
jgi:hypothetical protein